MEPEEGLEKLRDAVNVCHDYQAAYHNQADNLAPFFTDRSVVGWDFKSSLIFARLTNFTSQLNTMQVGLQLRLCIRECNYLGKALLVDNTYTVKNGSLL